MHLLASKMYEAKHKVVLFTLLVCIASLSGVDGGGRGGGGNDSETVVADNSRILSSSSSSKESSSRTKENGRELEAGIPIITAANGWGNHSNFPPIPGQKCVYTTHYGCIIPNKVRGLRQCIVLVLCTGIEKCHTTRGEGLSAAGADSCIKCHI